MNHFTDTMKLGFFGAAFGVLVWLLMCVICAFTGYGDWMKAHSWVVSNSAMSVGAVTGLLLGLFYLDRDAVRG